MKRRRYWIWAGIAIIALILGGLQVHRSVPSVDKQLDRLDPIILVNITEPLNGQPVQLDIPTSVFISLSSAEGLQNLQAYADGIPLASIAFSPLGQSPVIAWYVWTPGTEGWHVLIARATGSDGSTIISDPVRVEAVLPTTLPDSLPPAQGYPPDMPVTLFGISSDAPDFDAVLDAEVERLLSLGEGQQVIPEEPPSIYLPMMEVEPVAIPSVLQQAPPPASPLQKYLLWFAGRINMPASLPAAPMLGGSVQECTVRMWVEDRAEDELGFRLYRLGPLETGWSLAADLQALDGTGAFELLDPDRSPGRHTYYLASYNARGENPGNLLDLEVTDDACSANGPQVISMRHAVLTPAIPVDRLYCYASLDGSDWSRIPRQPQEFIQPLDGAFDLSPHLRALGLPGTSPGLQLECWGWQAGSLLPLGSGCASLADAQGPLEFDGDKFHFEADAAFDHLQPGDRLPELLTIVPPVNMHYPGSQADCDVFSGNDAAMEWACANLIDPWTGEPTSGHRILVWHYYDFCQYDAFCNGYLPWDQVAGYHVYRQTKNALDEWNDPILIRTVERYDVLMTVLSPGETTSASERTRYFVRAFVSDGYESTDSNYLQAVPANFRMTIPALYIQGISVRSFKPGGKIVGIDIEPGPLGSIKIVDGGDSFWVSHTPVLEQQTEVGFQVGYIRSHATHMPKTHSIIFDAWVQFDLTQVPGTITDADLVWDGELVMGGPGWDKWTYQCFNYMTTFYGFPVLDPPFFTSWGDTDVTNYVLLQQQAEDLQQPVGGMTPGYFGFYMWSGLRTHYTTEYRWDTCHFVVKNVRLEVEYTK
jgi:hypothetical protein